MECRADDKLRLGVMGPDSRHQGASRRRTHDVGHWLPNDRVHDRSELLRKHRGYSVANLVVLLGSGPTEDVVFGECLKDGRFAHGETSALTRIVVDEVVSILRDVGSDRGRRTILHLYSESVGKVAAG